MSMQDKAAARATQVIDPPSELPTGPRVTAAPLWRRGLASLVDLLPPLMAWLALTWLLVVLDPAPPRIPPWNLLDQVVDYLHDRPGRSALAALLFVTLQVAWPWVLAGRTPGRRWLGLALVDVQARPATRSQVLRWALWRVPSLAFAGGGAWWAFVDVERRTLHDRLGRLWLVRR